MQLPMGIASAEDSKKRHIYYSFDAFKYGIINVKKKF